MPKRKNPIPSMRRAITTATGVKPVNYPNPMFDGNPYKPAVPVSGFSSVVGTKKKGAKPGGWASMFRK